MWLMCFIVFLHLDHLVFLKTTTATRAKWLVEILQLCALDMVSTPGIRCELQINDICRLFLASHFVVVGVSAAEKE